MANLHDTQPNDEEIRNDIDEINKLNALTQGQKLTMREFLSQNRAMNRWRASVACGCQAMQQIGGVLFLSSFLQYQGPISRLGLANRRQASTL